MMVKPGVFNNERQAYFISESMLKEPHREVFASQLDRDMIDLVAGDLPAVTVSRG